MKRFHFISLLSAVVGGLALQTPAVAQAEEDGQERRPSARPRTQAPQAVVDNVIGYLQGRYWSCECSPAKQMAQGTAQHSLAAGQGLAYELANAATIALTLELTWQDDQGEERGRARFDLKPGETRLFSMFFPTQDGTLDLTSTLTVWPASGEGPRSVTPLWAVAAYEVIEPGVVVDETEIATSAFLCTEQSCTIQHDIRMPPSDASPGSHGPHDLAAWPDTSGLPLDKKLSAVILDRIHEEQPKTLSLETLTNLAETYFGKRDEQDANAQTASQWDSLGVGGSQPFLGGPQGPDGRHRTRREDRVEHPDSRPGPRPGSKPGSQPQPPLQPEPKKPPKPAPPKNKPQGEQGPLPPPTPPPPAPGDHGPHAPSPGGG